MVIWKLDREKRKCVHYRRVQGEITLRTLSHFLMNIFEDACEANVDVEVKPLSKRSGRQKQKEEGALYCHSEASSSADQRHQRGEEAETVLGREVCGMRSV